MDDGTQVEYGPPVMRSICQPDHDAWIVGDKRCVLIDFTGVVKYAKARLRTSMPAVSMSLAGAKRTSLIGWPPMMPQSGHGACDPLRTLQQVRNRSRKYVEADSRLD